MMMTHQVLFGENTIPLVDKAYKKRIEDRKDVIEAERQVAEEPARNEDPTDQCINK